MQLLFTLSPVRGEGIFIIMDRKLSGFVLVNDPEESMAF